MTKDNVGQVRPSRKDPASRLEADDAPEALGAILARLIPRVEVSVEAKPERDAGEAR